MIFGYFYFWFGYMLQILKLNCNSINQFKVIYKCRQYISINVYYILLNVYYNIIYLMFYNNVLFVLIFKDVDIYDGYWLLVYVLRV